MHATTATPFAGGSGRAGFAHHVAPPAPGPGLLCTSSRPSVPATTATPFAGGSGRSALSKPLAYSSLFFSRSSVTLTYPSVDCRLCALSISGHVGLEGVGDLVDGRQRFGVLPLHIPHEHLLAFEVHLRVGRLLVSENGVLAALVIVAGKDQQPVRQCPVRVIERVVGPHRVAVGQAGPAAGAHTPG